MSLCSLNSITSDLLTVFPMHLHSTSSFSLYSTSFTSLLKLRSLPCPHGLIQYQITHKPLPHPYIYFLSSPNICPVCQLGKWQHVVPNIVQPDWPLSYCPLAAGWSRGSAARFCLSISRNTVISLLSLDTVFH